MIKARITNLEKDNLVAYEGEIVKMDKRFGTTYDIEIRVDQHLHCIFNDIDDKYITIIQNEGKAICSMDEVEVDEINRCR